MTTRREWRRLLSKPLLPPEVFDFVPALYPHLLECLKNAEISGSVFLALSYTKRFSKPTDRGEALLLWELTGVLVQTGLYKDRKSAGGFIDDLVNQGFLRKDVITKTLRNELWPDAGGYSHVVVLEKSGKDRLAEVNSQIQLLAERAVTPVARPGVRLILKTFRPLANELIERLDAARQIMPDA